MSLQAFVPTADPADLDATVAQLDALPSLVNRLDAYGDLAAGTQGRTDLQDSLDFLVQATNRLKDLASLGLGFASSAGVATPGVTVPNAIPLWGDATGTSLIDSTTLLTDLILGGGTGVAGNATSWTSTTAIGDSGVPMVSVLRTGTGLAYTAANKVLKTQALGSSNVAETTLEILTNSISGLASVSLSTTGGPALGGPNELWSDGVNVYCFIGATNYQLNGSGAGGSTWSDVLLQGNTSGVTPVVVNSYINCGTTVLATATGDFSTGSAARVFQFVESSAVARLSQTVVGASQIQVYSIPGSTSRSIVSVTADVGGTAKGFDQIAYGGSYTSTGFDIDQPSTCVLNASFFMSGGLVFSTFGDAPIAFYTGASVNGRKRWEIQSTTLGGHLVPGLNATYDVGSDAARVRNVHTGDVFVNGQLFGNNLGTGLVVGTLPVGAATGSTFRALNVTTAERDFLTGTDGMVAFNTTTNRLETWVSGAWQPFTTVGEPALNDLTDVDTTGVATGNPIYKTAGDYMANTQVVLGTGVDPHRFDVVTAITNDVARAMIIRHETTGATPTPGFGVALSFELEDTAGVYMEAAYHRATWASSTTGPTKRWAGVNTFVRSLPGTSATSGTVALVHGTQLDGGLRLFRLTANTGNFSFGIGFENYLGTKPTVTAGITMLAGDAAGLFTRTGSTDKRILTDSPASGTGLSITNADFVGAGTAGVDLTAGSGGVAVASSSFITTGTVKTSAAAGSPEGAVVGSVGDTYTNSTTGVKYQKESGVGNTGWSIAAEIPAPGATGFGDALRLTYFEVELTGLAGATVTAANLIPAGSTIVALGLRVTTTITGATSFDAGDTGAAIPGAYGVGLALPAGTVAGPDDWTINGPNTGVNGRDVVLTANGGNFTAGAVRISGWAQSYTAPTS